MALLLIVVASLVINSLCHTVVHHQKETVTTPFVPILRQINHVGENGSYTYGFESADGTFKAEYKDIRGNVNGKYGYIDAGTGQLKVITYSVGINSGFRIISDTLLDPSKELEDHVLSLDPKSSIHDVKKTNEIQKNTVVDQLKDTNTPSSINLDTQELQNVILPTGVYEATQNNNGDEQMSSSLINNINSNLQTNVEMQSQPEIILSHGVFEQPEKTLINKLDDMAVIKTASGFPSPVYQDDKNSLFEDKLDENPKPIEDPMMTNINMLPAGTFSLNDIGVNPAFSNALKFKESPRSPKSEQETVMEETLKLNEKPPMVESNQFNVPNNDDQSYIKNPGQPIFVQENDLHPTLTNNLGQNQVKMILLPKNVLEGIKQQPLHPNGYPLIGFIVPKMSPQEKDVYQFLQQYSNNFQFPLNSPINGQFSPFPNQADLNPQINQIPFNNPEQNEYPNILFQSQYNPTIPQYQGISNIPNFQTYYPEAATPSPQTINQPFLPIIEQASPRAIDQPSQSFELPDQKKYL